MPFERPSEPWLSLLRELDIQLNSRVDLVCIGGFALIAAYDAPRTTADLDVLWTIYDPNAAAVLQTAQRGSELHQKFAVYIDLVTIATPPCNYAERLRAVFASTFEHLRLLVPDPYDLALLKIDRNAQRDREDLRWLARVASLHPSELHRRYREELRPYLIGPTKRHDQTIDLWV